uniref:GGDEF domain-containing protein n=1 Tax=Paractinoplanes polyasparticus TaxID=2856853 RepID=UPI001C843AB1|nr:GGDEF domain-containing protein [Actinoplanes polyasparticus]
MFRTEAENALAQKRPVAVLFLDLDGFKPVNDRYGHAAGDTLLAEVARRLVAVIRPEDVVSRFGGDEFLVLGRGMGDEHLAYATADRIRGDPSRPVEIDGQTVRIGVSVGIAVSASHTVGAEALVHNADLTLYRAKGNGRGRIECSLRISRSRNANELLPPPCVTLLRSRYRRPDAARIRPARPGSVPRIMSVGHGT